MEHLCIFLQFAVLSWDQLDSESMKLKQLEDKSNQKERKLLSIISNQDDKIRNLESKLQELNEAQKGIQRPPYKREVKSKKVVPDKPELSLGISGISPESENLETIFQDMKEECHRIRMLAREQTDQLSIFKIKPEPETGNIILKLLL